MYDKLKIDGVLYVWDEARNDRAVLSPKTFTRGSTGARDKSEEVSQSTESKDS